MKNVTVKGNINKKEVTGYKTSLVTKEIPIKRFVDNGNPVTTKKQIEEVVVEPMYYGDIEMEDQEYEVLTPEEFSKMDEEDIKKWYKSRRKGK